MKLVHLDCFMTARIETRSGRWRLYSLEDGFWIERPRGPHATCPVGLDVDPAWCVDRSHHCRCLAGSRRRHWGVTRRLRVQRTLEAARRLWAKARPVVKRIHHQRTTTTSAHRQVGWLGSVVVGRRTCDREVASSTPGRCIAGQPKSTQPSIPPGR